MRATAEAQPNIALIKYWGKRDDQRNLPATGSISITLDSLKTRMSVDLSGGAGADSLTLNGESAARMLPRISACLDSLLSRDRPAAVIDSECNFPVAAGLASSASAFAALVVAVNKAAGLGLDRLALARAAGRASGSAARSLFGGFAELSNEEDAIHVRSLRSADEWPLEVVVAITASGEKAVGSGDAMKLSAKTSPFYKSWVEQQDDELAVARAAIDSKDFAALAKVSEHNCLKMHSVMWVSRPPLVYWNAATLSCMETVRRLQSDGVAAFFTIDAGPQVKAVCLPEFAQQVHDALQATQGVVSTMRSSLGRGACDVDDA